MKIRYHEHPDDGEPFGSLVSWEIDPMDGTHVALPLDVSQVSDAVV